MRQLAACMSTRVPGASSVQFAYRPCVWVPALFCAKKALTRAVTRSIEKLLVMFEAEKTKK